MANRHCSVCGRAGHDKRRHTRNPSRRQRERSAAKHREAQMGRLYSEHAMIRRWKRTGKMWDGEQELWRERHARRRGAKRNPAWAHGADRTQVAFTTDKHGRPLAYRWSVAAGGRWLRVGYDEAKLAIATGKARETRYAK
jgi:hypothetical protein